MECPFSMGRGASLSDNLSGCFEEMQRANSAGSAHLPRPIQWMQHSGVGEGMVGWQPGRKSSAQARKKLTA